MDRVSEHEDHIGRRGFLSLGGGTAIGTWLLGAKVVEKGNAKNLERIRQYLSQDFEKLPDIARKIGLEKRQDTGNVHIEWPESFDFSYRSEPVFSENFQHPQEYFDGMETGDCEDYAFALKSVLDPLGYQTAIVVGDDSGDELLGSLYHNLDHVGLEVEIDGEVFYGDVGDFDTLYPREDTTDLWVGRPAKVYRKRERYS